jgi:hypothetical protein
MAPPPSTKHPAAASTEQMALRPTLLPDPADPCQPATACDVHDAREVAASLGLTAAEVRGGCRRAPPSPLPGDWAKSRALRRFRELWQAELGAIEPRPTTSSASSTSEAASASATDSAADTTCSSSTTDTTDSAATACSSSTIDTTAHRQRRRQRHRL